MNQLTVVEKNAFEKLPLGLQEFAANRMEKTVGQMSDSDLKNPCQDIITVSFAEQNQYGVDARILAHQRDFLIAELKDRRFKTLTLSEVRSAFKAGIRGDSGPFFGLCPKTYYQFLKHFYEKPERTQAMKEFLALTEAENLRKVEKPIHVKNQETTESCLKAFDEYKVTKVLPFTAFAFYDHLWKELGVIKLTQEVKEKIRIETEQEYIIELKQSKVRGQIKQSEYENIVANLGGDQNRTFINMVKKKALAFYWDSIISSGKDLKDLI